MMRRAPFVLIILLSIYSTWTRADVGIEQRLGASLPRDVRLQDDDGRWHRFGELAAHGPMILTFGFYSCPRLCTLVFDDIANALEALPDPLRRATSVVIVSIDPGDGPASAHKARRALLARHEGVPFDTWHFASGTRSEVARLAAAAGFRYEIVDETAHEFRHASGIAVISSSGQVSRYLLGLGYPAAELAQALTQASESKIGPRAEGLALFCAHLLGSLYGRYSQSVLTASRVLGVVCVCALGAVIVLGARRHLGGAP